MHIQSVTQLCLKSQFNWHHQTDTYSNNTNIHEKHPSAKIRSDRELMVPQLIYTNPDVIAKAFFFGNPFSNDIFLNLKILP